MSARERQWRRQLDDQDRWKLALLTSHVRKHGWAGFSAKTIIPPGVKIGQWVDRCRMTYRSGSIRPFLVTGLERIPGWSCNVVRERYTRIIDVLRRFVRRLCWDALLPASRVDGVPLSKWCGTRREDYQRGVLHAWVVRALEAIPGWSWEPRRARSSRKLEQFRRLVAAGGMDAVQHHVPVRKWLQQVRCRRREGKLSDWLARELEAIDGWTWQPRVDRLNETLAVLRRFLTKHGWDACTATRSSRGTGSDCGSTAPARSERTAT